MAQGLMWGCDGRAMRSTDMKRCSKRAERNGEVTMEHVTECRVGAGAGDGAGLARRHGKQHQVTG